MPQSRAACTAPMASSSSTAWNTAPSDDAPKLRRETSRPVRPSGLRLTSAPLLVLVQPVVKAADHGQKDHGDAPRIPCAFESALEKRQGMIPADGGDLLGRHRRGEQAGRDIDPDANDSQQRADEHERDAQAEGG